MMKLNLASSQPDNQLAVGNKFAALFESILDQREKERERERERESK